jgi:hypothetical protein
MKSKKLAKVIWLMAVGLGLVLMTTAPVLADQIVVCQSCTSAPGGDPNLITNSSSFNMFLSGSTATSLAPTLIVIAEYNGGPQPTVTVGAISLSLATPGNWGLTQNIFVGFNSLNSPPPDTAFSEMGLSAGGSLNFGNLRDNVAAEGIAAPSSFTLYAFQYNGGLSHTPILVGTNAENGSYVFGYGCSESPMNGTCNPPGSISQTVMTNGGLIKRVPEPGSLLLLGSGLAGIGLLQWKRRKAGQA